jgi:hypothetical protein
MLAIRFNVEENKYEITNGVDVLGQYETNAEAWRALDRMYGDPINKSEAKSEYLWGLRLDF